MLSKEEIFAIDDIATETISIPEWGGDVRVRVLTGKERDAWEFSVYGGDGDSGRINFRARLCARCMVDEDGVALLTDEDVAGLGNKSGAVIDRIFVVCQRLNGLTQKDVEELEKNSDADPADSLPSD